MSGGRPHKPRSAPLSGVGRPLEAPEHIGLRRAVWDVLLQVYDDPAELPVMEMISDAFAAYGADEQSLANQAGAAEELADAEAIKADCYALARVVSEVVAGSREWPRPLCARLLNRLENFPPTVDALLAGAGIDIWPEVERLRLSVCRPAHWRDCGIQGDLERLADAMSAPLTLPHRTKPHATARARLIERIRGVFGEYPPDFADNKSDLDGLVIEVLESLKIKATKRL